jgi:hypothetical protein
VGGLLSTLLLMGKVIVGFVLVAAIVGLVRRRFARTVRLSAS